MKAVFKQATISWFACLFAFAGCAAVEFVLGAFLFFCLLVAIPVVVGVHYVLNLIKGPD